MIKGDNLTFEVLPSLETIQVTIQGSWILCRHLESSGLGVISCWY